MREQPPGSRLVASRERWQLVAGAAVPTLLSVLEVRSGPPLPLAPGLTALAVTLLALASGLPLLQRRRAPLRSAAAVLAASALSVLLVPVPPYAAPVAVASFAAHRDPGRDRERLFGVALAAAAVLGLAGLRWGATATWLPLFALVTLVALLAGLLAHARRAELQALRDRADALERERDAAAARAVAEERLRVARDLHDLVGHGLSAIAVQSSTARMALSAGAVPTAVEALTSVEAVTRESLAEMRQVLGALRSAPDAPSAPAPGLRDLPALVAHAAAAGCAVSSRVSGDVSAVPASVQLAAYRIVQEALTNVVRHAPGAAVDLCVLVEPDAVDVVVDDRPAAAAPPPGGAPASLPRQDRGHGLLGMRERAAACGGTVHAGPAEGVGWRVAARLPVAPPEPS